MNHPGTGRPRIEDLDPQVELDGDGERVEARAEVAGRRENGVRTGFIGVDTRRMRWAAFTVAGTFGGLAGALFGMYHRGMYIENAYWTESAQVLIMVLLGGIYSFVGPIIGAAVLYLLQIFTNQYTVYWPTVLGLILLVIVLVLPDGLIGLMARIRALRRA